MTSQEQYFELLIWLPGQGPMRSIVKAKTVQDAVHWAKFRYKNARVEVPEPAAKPDLARSHTSPGLLKKRHLKNQKTND